MNYQNLYVNLLLKHGTEEKPKGYSERHHILPKSLGGRDVKDNLIYLSARAHFLAHWLLYKMTPCQETARALFGMCDNHRLYNRPLMTGRKYELAKKAFSEHNHMKLPEHKERASESARKQWHDRYDEMKDSNSFMFNDPNHPMYMKGKVGDKHPRSRAVITPLGRFGSVRQAGKAHDIYHSIISRYCKSKDHPQYYYEDGGV